MQNASSQVMARPGIVLLIRLPLRHYLFNDIT